VGGRVDVYPNRRSPVRRGGALPFISALLSKQEAEAMIHQYVWIFQLIGVVILIGLIDSAPRVLTSWTLRSLSVDVTQPIDDKDYEELARDITKQIMDARETE